MINAKKCNVTGKMWPDGMVRSCPNPAVIKKYGINGACNVVLYVCKKCKYGKKWPGFDGWSCKWGEDLNE